MQNIQKLKTTKIQLQSEVRILFEVQSLKYKNQNLKCEAQKLKHLLSLYVAQATR